MHRKTIDWLRYRIQTMLNHSYLLYFIDFSSSLTSSAPHILPSLFKHQTCLPQHQMSHICEEIDSPIQAATFQKYYQTFIILLTNIQIFLWVNRVINIKSNSFYIQVPLMSILATNSLIRSRRTTGNGTTGVSYGSSSVAKRNENIVTGSQGYDNYYGKTSVQKEPSKNNNITNAAYIYNSPSYNKQSGTLPKITQNYEKRDQQRPRILYSRQKNARKEKEEVNPPSLITQSQIKKTTDSKLQLGESSKQYLRQLPQQRQTPLKQSKQDLDQIFKTKTIGLVGLSNIGNTCFMNSILQCMLNLPKFNDYFLQNQHTRQISSNGRVAIAYGKLVQLIRSSTSRAQTPSDIKAAVSAKKTRFSGYGQQDAQQFLLALLQLLSLELNRSKNPKYKELSADLSKNTLQQISEQWWSYNRQRENSVVCDYFAGQILSKVICGACSNESIAFDNTWDYCLNFSYNDNGDIVKMIENFLKEENISQDYYCVKCKKFRDCKRKIFLYRLPQILVLQIKRFSYGKYSKQKMNNRIKVPTLLNLSKVITYTHHQSVKTPIYDLVGVVNHSGDLNFGHYTADCKNPINNRWYTFNDSTVSQMSMGQQFQSSSPYLLFYYKK